MRILLSARWKEAESFALGRGNQDSTSLLVLGGSNPCLPPRAHHKDRQGHITPFRDGTLRWDKWKRGLTQASPLLGLVLLLELSS